MRKKITEEFFLNLKNEFIEIQINFFQILFFGRFKNHFCDGFTNFFHMRLSNC